MPVTYFGKLSQTDADMDVFEGLWGAQLDFCQFLRPHFRGRISLETQGRNATVIVKDTFGHLKMMTESSLTVFLISIFEALNE